MPPEQARGAPPDPRGDLYALGAMLFELLCGELPFPGADAPAILAQHAGAPRPSVAARNPAIAPALDALVTQLMAIDPGERPPSAAALLERLDALAPDGPAPVPAAARAPARRGRPAAAGARRRAPGRRSSAAHGRARRAARHLAPRASPASRASCSCAATPGSARRGCAPSSPARSTREGGTVLYGRCEEEALAPYGPFVEALRHFAVQQPDLPEQLRAARRASSWRGSAGPCRARAPQAPPAPGSDRAAGRYQLFEAAVMLVARDGGPRAAARDLRRRALGRRADAAAAAPPRAVRRDRPGDARVHAARRRARAATSAAAARSRRSAASRSPARSTSRAQRGRDGGARRRVRPGARGRATS